MIYKAPVPNKDIILGLFVLPETQQSPLRSTWGQWEEKLPLNRKTSLTEIEPSASNSSN